MRNCSCIIAEHAAKGDEWHKEAINGVQMRLACIKMASWEKKGVQSAAEANQSCFYCPFSGRKN